MHPSFHPNPSPSLGQAVNLSWFWGQSLRGLVSLDQLEIVEDLGHGNLDLHDGKSHGYAVPGPLAKAHVCVGRTTRFALRAEVVWVVQLRVGEMPVRKRSQGLLLLK